MAWIYSLSIECGPSEEKADQCVSHFETFKFVAELQDYSISIRKNSDGQQPHANWWVMVYSPELPTWGVSDLTTANQLSAAGEALLEHLKAFSRFRFAIIGVEAFEAITFSELNADLEIDERFISAFQGLLITTEIWETMQKPNVFQQFNESHVGIPYLGEKVNG